MLSEVMFAAMKWQNLLIVALFLSLPLAGSGMLFGQDVSAFYTYQVWVSLKGHITSVEAAPAGEKPARVFVLKLEAPITVMGRPDDKANRVTEKEVTRIQLHTDSAELLETLAQFEKSQALTKVSGKLWRDAEGKHNTPVVMEAARAMAPEGEQ